MSGFFEILQGLQELQIGREIANRQTDGHRGDNIIRTLRAYNKAKIVGKGECVQNHFSKKTSKVTYCFY